MPLELSYFEEAVDYLLKHPAIKSDRGIGICAISKAAEIALCMAAALPASKIGAVVLLNTLVNFTVMPIHYNGKIFCDGN